MDRSSTGSLGSPSYRWWSRLRGYIHSPCFPSTCSTDPRPHGLRVKVLIFVRCMRVSMKKGSAQKIYLYQTRDHHRILINKSWTKRYPSASCRGNTGLYLLALHKNVDPYRPTRYCGRSCTCPFSIWDSGSV